MKLTVALRRSSASPLVLAASMLTASALLTGCSSKFDPMAGTTPPQTAIGSLKGSVYGGRTAITGASVYLYETGTTGYGSASTSLLTSYPNGSSSGGGPTTPDSNGNYYVTTDGNGYFNISGDYTCTAGGQVYTYAVGGNANGGTGINSAVGLIAALGVCPASGTLAGTLPYINMNEASTIAAAYALAGFSADALHIGIPTSTNTTLATLEQTNLSNAFLTAANIFPMSSPVPTSSFASATAATGSSGTLPTAELNALANSLAACINSDGPTSTPCTDVLENGTTDTASAAIYIAQNPGTNVSTIFGAAAGTALPYNNALSTAPNDWTLSIAYTGGGMVAQTSFSFLAHPMAIDASGNIWIGNTYSSKVIYGFSNLGVPLTNGTSGFKNSCLAYTGSIALDAASANLWITNPLASSTTAAQTLCVYNIAGNSWTTITPVSGTTKQLNEPSDIGFDGSGNIWVASTNNEEVVKLTSAGAYSTKAQNTSYVYYPSSLAIEPGAAGNVWVTGQGSGTSKKYADLFTNADAYSSYVTTDYYEAFGLQIDASGNAWSAGLTAGLTKIPAAGGSTTIYAYPTEHSTVDVPSSAIDGAGNTWLTDYDNGLIYEYSNTGAFISGTYGYVPGAEPSAWIPPAAPPSGYLEIDGIVVDGSGNVWYTSPFTPKLEEMVGAAVPVVTPLSYATANNLLGQEP